MRNHGIGSAQDIGTGTVVLLQPHGLRAGEILQETLDVFNLGTAPAIDGLVVVAHHEHVARFAGQHAHESILDGVGVLKLVHQNFAEACAVMRQQCRRVAQQLVRAQQQFGEIQQTGAVAAFLIGRVHLPADLGPIVVGLGLDVLRTPAFVFLFVDPPAHLLGRILALVQLQRLHHALDQPQLVIAVHDLEAFRQPRILPMQTQQAMRQSMEGADPHPATAVAQLQVGAVAHFTGGLVGEGHREDAVVGHALNFIEPGNTMDQHARLAGAGASQHEVMPRRCGNGLALGGV